jgi:hypothetical protein
MGPCEVVPRTQYIPTSQQPDVRGVSTASPAGTVMITNYAILHRRSPSLASNWVGPPMTRYMLKWCYWRLAAPQRDWIVEEDFNYATADYGGHFDYRAAGARDVAKFVAEAFYWLCGMPMPKLVGGQAWPVCGPARWNPVDKTGPWFSPNPDGTTVAAAGSRSGGGGGGGGGSGSLASMLERIQFELGLEEGTAAKLTLQQAWEALGDQPKEAQRPLKQQASTILSLLLGEEEAAQHVGHPPRPAAAAGAHPADNFHFSGPNPGNTVGLGEVLAELASLKAGLASL